MESQLVKRNKCRLKRVMRIRKKLRGTSERPRMCVHKSNKHLCIQLIDDERGVTIVSLGTLSRGLKEGEFGKKSKEAARHIGMKIAQVAKEKQFQKVVLDRGRFKYHGVIAELANAAREAGLEF